MFSNKKSLILSIFFSCISIALQIMPNNTKLTKITKSNFITEVLHTKSFVILDVFAPWCQPCQQMNPIIDKLAQEFPNIKFATINVDEESELAAALEVATVPTFIIFYQGKFVTGFAGQKSYDDFKKIITSILYQKSK